MYTLYFRMRFSPPLPPPSFERSLLCKNSITVKYSVTRTMTLGATSSSGSSRFPIWRRLIGKREDPGDEVAVGDVCIIGHVIIII